MWEQPPHTSAADSNLLGLATGSCGTEGGKAALPTSLHPPVSGGMGHPSRPTPWRPVMPRTMTHQQKEENVAENLRGGRWVGSEIMTQEILRLQMKLKGENIMGVKAEGYIIAVIEFKCTYLISLTASICWFKSSKHLGKPDAPPPVACWVIFYLCGTQDNQRHQKGKFGSKMCGFRKASQVTDSSQDGGTAISCYGAVLYV